MLKSPTAAIKSLLGAGLLALSAGSLAAAPAVVERDSNFRTGPGTNYRSMAVLPQGTVVDVQDCGGRWCAVSAGPQEGYIAQSLLSFGAAAVAPAPQYYGYRSPPYGGYSYPRYTYGSYAYGTYATYPRYAPYGYYRDYYYRPGVSIGFGFGY